MPTFNSEAFLDDALKGIFNSTYQNLQVVVVDDFSNDGTLDILEKWRKQESRLSINPLPYHAGNNVARNNALTLAQGKYVVIADSDDVTLPNRIMEQVTYLDKHPDIDGVTSSLMHMDESGKTLRVEHFPKDQKLIKAGLWFKNQIPQPSMTLRLETLQRLGLNYDPDFENCGDYHLWWRMSCLGAQFTSRREPLVHYRKHDYQISKRLLGDRHLKIKEFMKLRLYALGLDPSLVEHLYPILYRNQTLDSQAWKSGQIALQSMVETLEAKVEIDKPSLNQIALKYALPVLKKYPTSLSSFFSKLALRSPGNLIKVFLSA